MLGDSLVSLSILFQSFRAVNAISHDQPHNLSLFFNKSKGILKSMTRFCGRSTRVRAMKCFLYDCEMFFCGNI